MIFSFVAVLCDAACSIMFLRIVMWMRGKEITDIALVSKHQIVASAYSVQVVSLPKHSDLQQLKQDLRDHLEQLLTKAPPFTVALDRVRIADIQFGRNTAGHLDLLRKRGVVVRKLEVELQRLEKFKMLEGRIEPKKFEKRLETHLKKTKKLDVRIYKGGGPDV